MTINTETIRDAAEVLDTLTSALAVDHPLRVEATSRAKSCVSGLYSAADALDAQTAETAEIAEARSQIDRWQRAAESAEDRAQAAANEIDRLRKALTTIEQWEVPLVESRGEVVSMSVEYGSNGVRDYFRGVARAALAQEQGGSDANRDR